MSILGPPVIRHQLQYLSDEDEDAGDVAPEPINVRMSNFFDNYFSFKQSYIISHGHYDNRKIIVMF